MTYTIILPTLNRPELVRGFLACVEKQTLLPYEVIVVDQSDNRATGDLLDIWSSKRIVKKYIYREIKSLVLARHAGLDACGETDLVVFFDDDVILDRRFCEEMVEVFLEDKNNKYAGGMGKVYGCIYKPKPFQSFFLMPHEGSGCFLPSGVQTFPYWKKEFSETEFLPGGCTFWRRKIIQKYRFDERLSGLGLGDDVDISYRIARDYKLFFQPKAVCYQIDNPPGKSSGRKYRKAWVQNMFYLAQKNGVFMPAFAWCVLGHILRDAICMDLSRITGDIEGIMNIFSGRIDTVQGYDDFKRQLKINKKRPDFKN
jgi:glycosyltransferase involved in cell wall biosynthesis